MSNSCSMPSSSSQPGGTFTTVKASAPNTIEYLPSAPPNSQAQGPRGPPRLDFLHRFANPNMDKNMGPNGPMGMGSNGPMTSMNGPMGMNGPMMGPGGPMGPGPRGMT